MQGRGARNAEASAATKVRATNDTRLVVVEVMYVHGVNISIHARGTGHATNDIDAEKSPAAMQPGRMQSKKSA